MESCVRSGRLICEQSRWVRWTWLHVSIITCWNLAQLYKAPLYCVHVDSLGAMKVGQRAMSLLGHSGTESTTMPTPLKWLLTPALSSTPILYRKSREKYSRRFATSILAPLSSQNDVNLIIPCDNPWTGLGSLPAHHRQTSHRQWEDVLYHAEDHCQE